VAILLILLGLWQFWHTPLLPVLWLCHSTWVPLWITSVCLMGDTSQLPGLWHPNCGSLCLPFHTCPLYCQHRALLCSV
jgi:hypothetical protein